MVEKLRIDSVPDLPTDPVDPLNSTSAEQLGGLQVTRVIFGRTIHSINDAVHGIECNSIIYETMLWGYPAYEYLPLQNPDRDIRLAILLPGKEDDEIKLRIRHAPLDTLRAAQPRKLVVEEIQDTLPAGWKAHLTLDRERCLFLRERADGEGDAQWEHPDSEVERSIYTLEDSAHPASTLAAEFHALSYVWGTPSWFHRKRALVESSSMAGDVIWTQLSIGQNLDLALRDLRDPDEPRTMWIDAICINQADIAERGRQVKRMGDIYSQASQVIVWLGPGSDSADRAVDVLKHIGSEVELLDRGGLSSSPGKTAFYHRADLQMGFTDDQWKSVQQLVTRPWFSRVWVAQEALLGGSRVIVQSGRSMVSWDLFHRSISTLYQNHYIAPDLKSDLGRPRALCDTDPSREATKYIILMGALRFCSEPRDLVYGFLGLLPGDLTAHIHPDYSAELGAVYTDLTLAYIKHSRRLEIFDIAASGYKSDRCPSWVFDPYSLQNRGPYLVLEWPGQFCAHFSECQVQDNASGTLDIVGLRVAKVRSIKVPVPGFCESKTEEDALRSCIRTVRGWEPEYLCTGTYINGESLLEAYARTLICDNLRDRAPDSWCPTLQRWQGQWHTNALFGDLAKENQVDLSNLTRQEEAPLRMLVGRNFFSCDNEFMGIGPGNIKCGDIICILLGHENPVVLREQERGTYSLVGICYLHGVSDGTALLGPLPKPWVVHRHLDAGRQHMKCLFYNPDTGVLREEDPRLDPLPNEWERVPARDRTAEDPEIFQGFRVVATGEVIKSDPRLSVESLIKRGINLETFSLT
ncbi:hypothetical protein RRF57_002043 [Xylaria bambusicola]|uniref:Heterokaryon incompatibility domain-containing protein n=1 Tax=Xylaria bambusicola TaxID=326684 RepID=A0AAN7UDX6_9PEZI